MPIVFEGVSYAPNGKKQVPILKEVTVRFLRGEYIGLMGEPGCGKSELLQMAAGLLRPSEGRVFLDDEETNANGFPAGMSYLNQEPGSMLFERTVERELLYGMRRLELSAEEKILRITHVLKCLGMDYSELADRSPTSFSRSQRKLIAVAAILVSNPDYILLDEPFRFLDQMGCMRLAELLEEFRQNGACILVASNDTEFVTGFPSRLLVMEKGEIVRDCKPRQLLTDYYDLLRLGLPVPQTRELAQRLWMRNIQIPTGLLTYEQTLDRLKIIMWRKKQ